MISRRHFGAIAGGAALAAVARLAPAQPTEISSKKRGCCFTTKNNNWRQRVDALNPVWMYNWGHKRPSELSDQVNYVPMIWGNVADAKLDAVLAPLKERIAAGEVTHLLGFNEPDQEKQANMTVERVVELWPRLMELEVPLVSPGCVHPDREWMHEFMEQVEAKNLRVDAVAVHSYGGPNTVGLVRRLEKLHTEFGRPLWITEFAVGDWEAKSVDANRHTPDRIAKFMREVLPSLDSLSFVERYAWFNAGPKSASLGTSALFDASNQLTELGEIYRNV
jgi:hypothetical protein